MRKYLFALIIVITMFMSIFNNGSANIVTVAAEGKEGQVIRVAWWGSQERHDMTLEAIQLFTKETGIKVETEYTVWDGYWGRLNTQAAGSNLPDVIQMDNSYLSEFDSNSLLVDLNPFIQAGMIDLSDVDDIYQETLIIGDRTLGISAGANALGVIYNVDLAQEYNVNLEAGYSYEDLYTINIELAEMIRAEGFNYWGYDFANSEYELFNNFVRQHNESIYNDFGDGVGFNTQTLIDYFTWLHKMVADGAAPSHDMMLTYHVGAESMIQDGTSLMRTAASNQLIADQQGTDYELALTVLPSLDGIHANYIRPAMSWSISSNAKNTEAAAQFINFMTNNLAANEILQAERGVPISSVVREQLSEQVDDATLKTFSFLDELSDYTKPAEPISPPGETEVRASFLRIVEFLKNGQLTPEAAANQFVNEANSILK